MIVTFLYALATVDGVMTNVLKHLLAALNNTNKNHCLLLVKMIHHGWNKHNLQKATVLINTE